MGIRVITPSVLEPISAADLKAQVRYDEAAGEDGLLAACIAAARAKAENYMGTIIMRRTLEQTLDAFPVADFEIERPPAWNPSCNIACPLSLESISYVDAAGATQTLGPTEYALDTSVWPGYVLPAVDGQWPDTEDCANAVQVRLVLGYEAQSDVPGDIRSWLLLTAAFLYVNREAFDLGGKMIEIPSRFVDSLLDPYRVLTV